MKSVRFAASSDESDSDEHLKMKYDDSESDEEEVSKLFRVRGDSSSSDDIEPEPKTTTHEIRSEVSDYRAPYKEESVKRIDNLKSCMEKIHNGTKIGDNNSIFQEAKKLFDVFSKASKHFGDTIPKYFIRFLSMFEQYINDQWSMKTKISTKNRKSLPPLYGLMRPRFAEYRGEIDKFNAQNTDKYADDLFCDADDEEEDVPKKVVAKKRTETDDDELSESNCLGRITEIVSVKFKQRNIHEQTFEQLEELLDLVKKSQFSAGLEVKIIVSLLELVDLHITESGLIRDSLWKKFGRYFGMLLDHVGDIEVVGALEGKEESLFDKPLVVHCNISLMLEHLCLEYRKRLLAVDEFSMEFVERLREEENVIAICRRTRDYLKGRTYCADISSLLLDLIYYKYSHLYDGQLSSLIDEFSQDVFTEEDSSSVLSVRAVLSCVYHRSLHLMWAKAYELFCYSHVTELVGSMDAVTQAFYNRCLAQLGLCAFFSGRFEESYRCLGDIAAHPQIGHLMGHEADVGKVPLHIQVNIRMVEFAYLVSALLVQVPSKILGHKRKKDSCFKHFENVLTTVEKTIIRGPPEDIWEHVVQAAHFLRDGDWRKCFHTLTDSSSTSKLLSLVLNPDQFKASLLERIKCECLKMYLWSFGYVYSTISLSFLSDEFELALGTVETLVGGMIIGGVIDAFVRDGFVVMCTRSKSSSLILSLADKINEQINS